jgi:hypothetical protein
VRLLVMNVIFEPLVHLDAREARPLRQKHADRRWEAVSRRLVQLVLQSPAQLVAGN